MHFLLFSHIILWNCLQLVLIMVLIMSSIKPTLYFQIITTLTLTEIFIRATLHIIIFILTLFCISWPHFIIWFSCWHIIIISKFDFSSFLRCVIDKTLIVQEWSFVCFVSLWGIERIIFSVSFIKVYLIFSFDASDLVIIHFADGVRGWLAFVIYLFLGCEFIAVPPVDHFNVRVFLVRVVEVVLGVQTLSVIVHTCQFVGWWSQTSWMQCHRLRVV